MATSPIALILAAYPNRAAAARSARSLVRDGTLACATVAAGATAFYRWEGKCLAEASVLLWGKVAWSRAADAVAALKEAHPDRVPEILAFRVDKAHPAYTAWVNAAAPAATKRRAPGRKR
ncbi:MAG TPA: divalent cation tolerance protein CutA [Candidatus Eisenbacteria bacterium]|nr:divalent cation tolerance protein CutA [Candidatus Eisenbacteria bacterium]